jgi:hypothetical protein
MIQALLSHYDIKENFNENVQRPGGLRLVRRDYAMQAISARSLATARRTQ